MNHFNEFSVYLKVKMCKRTNSVNDGMLLSAFVMLTVALLHPTRKLGGPDGAVEGETLENIQSLRNIRNSARSWGSRPRTCPV